MIRVVQCDRAILRGHDDVLESHAPLARNVDAGLDAVRMAGFECQRVALDDVGILVLLHADAVAGAVDEVLAVARLVDDRTGRPVDILTRRADHPGGDADALRFVEHGVRLGHVGGGSPVNTQRVVSEQ